MLFSSTIFIYFFLPFVLFVYYVLLRKWRKLQNLFLLAASLLFYAYGEPKFVIVMILSIIGNYIFGRLVDQSKNQGNLKLSKTILIIAIVYNLSILFIFKYLSFVMKNIGIVMNSHFSIPEIALPIGISFFTFQAMSYVLDVYNGKGSVQKNIFNVGLYISFFPQLIAGPIVRYQTVADQIENRNENFEDFSNGFERFVIGLGKKVLLANNVALVADLAFNKVANGETLSILMAWLGMICYTLQIYFDFSGYSDMAIGLGKMFGFHFLENFNYPYISTSITEFWRRWHISLGTWFRDYVYIPLGGSRVNTQKLIRNLFIVWLLTGIWHGANWTYIVWGLMYFVLLAFEKVILKKKSNNTSINFIYWLYTIIFVMIGWVIFKSDSLMAAVKYIGYLFNINRTTFIDGVFIDELKFIKVYLSIGIICSMPIVPWLKSKIKKNIWSDSIVTIALLGIFVLSIASIVGSSYNPFIYFNF